MVKPTPKVTLLVQNLPVPFDRRVWMEATTLSSAGYRVSVVCPSDSRHPAGFFNIDGVAVLRYRAVPEGNDPLGYLREYVWAVLAMSMALFRLSVRQGKPDIIQFCNPPDLLFVVALPYKALVRTCLIFDQHDLGPELVRAKSLPLGRAFSLLAKFLERLTYAVSDAVIATNESYRRIAQTRGRKRFRDVAVVRSAPQRDSLKPQGADARYRCGQKYLLGYVGVMGVQEGIQYLLEAVRILNHERARDVHLALIGSGPQRNDLELIACQLEIEDFVTFYGRVPDDTLCRILSTADVCVNPDEVNELNDKSTMNKVVEYMALGRPIVQFDVTEGRFSAAESSLYARANDPVDFADCIETLLDDPDRRLLMGTCGRQRFATELCWENQVASLLNLYRHVLEKRRT